ncbi:YARHG domain-containing protein [Intestinibacter bartlettii]|uniref:YARHG domain-containing protein n=1 Tax=Intestinibacter bartlettii TaxID=261299 RepID=UPI0001631229|nr:YARHG domain-containing protein [Intestinibacter bartlettii]EDQ95683.1 hypothetical protein CLOBAR_02389 [Intestinibacter bartlettii DSM 16795]MCC2707678.1 YARHG domain-containing protein [Intestinibacter bartlettii]MCC2763128.1 YARHG domain-containing protein [Intestinibacter bartlettii]MDU2163414.1 YARHG domain-containing protein [Intestinibacter bartlettii]UWO80539.1 YARHG domain-containing protein [Intestinibacter bartlettii]
MICKRCNHINNDGAKFCIKCGAPMDENYSQSQNINYNQPNYNDYRYPNNNQTDWAQIIKIIIGTLVVVAVIVLLGKQFMGNDNSDVATQSEQAASSSNQQSQGSSQSNTDPAYNEYNNYTSKNEYNSYTNNNEYNSYTRNNSSSSNKTGGYIISYSSDVLLTSSDIQGLSKQQLRYARNEIYARHGRKFQSQDLRNYFNSKSWYRGVIEPSNFNDKTMLTNIEIKNIQFLKSVEDSM